MVEESANDVATGHFTDPTFPWTDPVIRSATPALPKASGRVGALKREAIEESDGFSASGANDADFTRERNATARAGKLFGIHAGEVNSSDINPALDLDPDFLVHMVHAEKLHLERIADSETPVVVCPRSNAVTDVGLPPVGDLLEATTVALGTDNVMLNSPSMFREMEHRPAASVRSRRP